MREPSIPPSRALTIALVCFALALICLAFIGCSSSATGKALNGGVIGSGVADYVTTRQVISSGRGREANRLFDHGPWTQGLLKAAGIGAVLGGTAWVEKEHRVLAHVLRIAVISVWAGAAMHNARMR